jgi:sec-independent protein translocase protein TatB
MDFLGMGWLEIFIVALVALIVLGPDKLPGYARKIGKFIRQFRKITSGVGKEISKAMDLDEVDEADEGIKKDLKAISKSLEEDAAELRKSRTAEAKAIQKTVADSTREASETLSRESAAISKSLAENAKAAKQEVAESVAEANRTWAWRRAASPMTGRTLCPATPAHRGD